MLKSSKGGGVNYSISISLKWRSVWAIFLIKKSSRWLKLSEFFEIIHTLKKEKGSFFRIAIKGGGCSGFQYNFSVDTEKEDDDIQYNNILIDKTSADLLKGSEVDFVKELIGEQFKISNPQSKSSCGCGVSFSL